MGALLDEFDAAVRDEKLEYAADPMFNETSRLEWRGYKASVTWWQGREWRAGASFFDYRTGGRDISGLLVFKDCKRDVVEKALLAYIRADIVKVEFMEEGPAKLVKLEGEIAALRKANAALQYDIKTLTKMILRLSDLVVK